MKKVFFLLNKISEFNFANLVDKYLSDCTVAIGEDLPDDTEGYDLIVLWSYRKILSNVADRKNIILFHSSDLPEGKGWAPIYNTIEKGKEYYVISGIFAGREVDSGDIIVKARFRMKDNYTAEYIREWDKEISVRLIREILTRFDKKEIKGMKQVGVKSFYPRRRPEDNEISLDAKVGDVVDKLRACEKNHPAFFVYRNTKYKILIEPWEAPQFPEDIQVVYYNDSSP